MNITKLLTALINSNHVIDEGRNGNWTWRKWSNGDAECWYRGNYGQITLSTNLGTDIVSAALSITFPFAFTEPPSCVVMFEGSDTGYSWIQAVGGTTSKATTTRSATFRLARIGTASIAMQNCVIAAIVKGKWK